VGVIACYRLSDQSASFEFFYWLVVVQAMGATEVVIDAANPKTSKMTLESIQSRLHNILIPGAALAGLPVRVGDYRRGMITARAPDIFSWVRSGKSFARLKSVKPPGVAKYTVTLRRQVGAPLRNSNELDWRKFAEEIGATVIEEYAVQPIHLHDRFSLYAGAEMNFGVCNGPVVTTTLTEYPVIMFVPPGSASNSMVKSGVPLGEQLPWALPWQRCVWKPDDLEEMRKVLAQWRSWQ